MFELFPRLQERQQSKGNQLSGGEQQMLATARALMTNPALLLLDEPLEGLAPIIVEELVRGLRKMITEEGTAVILVEQHAEIALSLTEHALLLERGAIVHRARSADLLKDHATLDRYIGLRVAEGERRSVTRVPACGQPGDRRPPGPRCDRCPRSRRTASRCTLGTADDQADSLTTALS